MKYDEKKARAIIEKHGLSLTTLRVWKSRKSIPDRYAEELPRVSLRTKIKDAAIETAIEKYGEELVRLLDSRKFKAGQKDSYYNRCFLSLCSECRKAGS